MPPINPKPIHRSQKPLKSRITSTTDEYLRNIDIVRKDMRKREKQVEKMREEIVRRGRIEGFKREIGEQVKAAKIKELDAVIKQSSVLKHNEEEKERPVVKSKPSISRNAIARQSVRDQKKE